jgi:hypothetical protein
MYQVIRLYIEEADDADNKVSLRAQIDINSLNAERLHPEDF